MAAGRSYALLVVLAVIWGLAIVANRRAGCELAPVTLTRVRWIIASAGFATFLPWVGRGRPPFDKRDLPRLLLISGMSVGVYHLSLNTAETNVSSSLAGLLISLAPMFMVILSAVALREKIGGRIAVALAMALSGALVIALSDFEIGYTSVYGPILVVVSALASAVNTVASKPLVHKYGSLRVAVWGSLAGTAMILPLIPGSFFGELASLSAAGWLSVLYLSLLSTVLANSIFYTLVSRGPVARLSIQLYVVPVVSVVGGILLLGEAITPFTVVGGAAILAAVAIATRAGR